MIPITALKIATLIFFLVPLIEMVILIEVGGVIGALPTIGLVILTAVVGVWLLRLEGLATLHLCGPRSKSDPGIFCAGRSGTCARSTSRADRVLFRGNWLSHV